MHSNKNFLIMQNAKFMQDCKVRTNMFNKSMKICQFAGLLVKSEPKFVQIHQLFRIFFLGWRCRNTFSNEKNSL